MNKNQKGFAPILIVTVILIIGTIGAFYLQRNSGKQVLIPNTPVAPKISTPSPTVTDTRTANSNANKIYNWIVATDQEKATWNTYTDSVNHFSIQYPKEWRQDKAYTEGEIVLTMDKPCKGCGGVGRGVYVKVLDNSNNLKSLEYVKKIIIRNNDYPNYPGFIYVIKNQPEYFAAFDATVIDGMSGAGSPGPASYIKNKDNKIIILHSDGVENDVVSKIFSTFKFLN